MTTTVSSIAFDASPKAPRNVEKLRELSIKLEATFLAEMLKVSEFGTPPKSMGGGAGEEQFGSFLRQAHADEMARSGGIGLAESLFTALSKSMKEAQ